MEDSVAKAQRLLAISIRVVNKLNAELKGIPSHLLWKWDLQVRYGLNGGGHAGADIGLKAIIPIVEEHRRHIAFQSHVDHGEYRRMLRRDGLSEPEIWTRFPPHTADERQDQLERMTAFTRAKREREEQTSEQLSEGLMKEFLLSEAKKAAKRTGETPSAILASPGFLAAATLRYNAILNIDLDDL
jgi:hypothetical protein